MIEALLWAVGAGLLFRVADWIRVRLDRWFERRRLMRWRREHRL